MPHFAIQIEAPQEYRGILELEDTTAHARKDEINHDSAREIAEKKHAETIEKIKEVAPGEQIICSIIEVADGAGSPCPGVTFRLLGRITLIPPK